MRIDLGALPTDVTALHEMIGALVAERDNERAEAQAEIDRLRNLVKVLQRSQFGRRSERLDQDQLHLGLEDLDGDIAQAEAALPAIPDEKVPPEPAAKERLNLPDHLEREDVTLDVEAETCPCCGGAIRAMATRWPASTTSCPGTGRLLVPPPDRRVRSGRLQRFSQNRQLIG